MRKNLSMPIFQELFYQHHLNSVIPLVQYGALALLLLTLSLLHVFSPYITSSSSLAVRLRKVLHARVVLGSWDLRGNRGMVLLLAGVIAYDWVACFLWIQPSQDPTIYHLPWVRYLANRAGNLCYAHLPLVMILVQRSSLLSAMTGASLAQLTWFHKWLGYITFVLGLIHIAYYGYFAIDPTNGFEYLRRAIQRQYYFFGLVAALAFVIIIVGSMRAVRQRWHEVFLVSHVLGSIVFFASCWLHWRPRYIFPLATIVIYFSSRLQRVLSVWLNHRQAPARSLIEKLPFVSAPYEAVVEVLDERCFRVDIEVDGNVQWRAGHFVFLAFQEKGLGFRQWHPFTIASVPTVPPLCPTPSSSVISTSHSSSSSSTSPASRPERLPLLSQATASSILPTSFSRPSVAPSRITIIVTPHSSMTRRLYDLALSKDAPLRTPVFIEGPYGSAAEIEAAGAGKRKGEGEGEKNEVDTLVLVGGGTGIAFARAVLEDVKQSGWNGRKIVVVWAVRERHNLEWLDIATLIDEISQTSSILTTLHQHYTYRLPLSLQPKPSSFSSSSSSPPSPDPHPPSFGRPDLAAILSRAQEEARWKGQVRVMVCGPSAMCGQVVDLVQGLVDPKRVAAGDPSGDVRVEVDLFD